MGSAPELLTMTQQETLSMIRLVSISRILLASSLAASLATPSALAGGSCGADGQILTRADLLARLGGNAVIEDFEAYSVGSGLADSLDVFCLDDTSIANGQGPGLVQPGATYCDPTSIQLQWNGDQYFSRTTKTLLANGSSGTIHITYSPAVTAMGVDLSAFVGYGYTGTATVYDPSNGVLGTVGFTLVSGGPERFFVGWADAGGIGRVEISNITWPWSPKLDDHAYGSCDGLGTKYCVANPNSAGGPADISASGSASSAAGDLTLTSTPVPNQNGIFFHGTNQVQNPFGNGFMCTAGGIVRGAVVMAVGNTATYTYDNSDAKHSMGAFIGTTRNCQHWFRDPPAGGAFFNLSNAIAIVILP